MRVHILLTAYDVRDLVGVGYKLDFHLEYSRDGVLKIIKASGEETFYNPEKIAQSHERAGSSQEHL